MEETQKIKKTKRSENETYKSLLANVNKINREINNLTDIKYAIYLLNIINVKNA